MDKWTEAIERAAERVKQLGMENADKLEIYTTLGAVARSGMSRIVSAFVMKDGTPICIARDVRVHGCGMDAGFELAYHIFGCVHGYTNEKFRYQDHLRHRWM